MAKTKVMTVEEIKTNLNTLAIEFYSNSRELEQLKSEISYLEEVSAHLHEEMSSLEVILDREENSTRHDN